MKDGFVRVASMTPKVTVADVRANLEAVKVLMKEAYDKGAAIVSFPELVLTGYTCNDLFLQKKLLDEAKKALVELKEYSSEFPGTLFFIGLPLQVKSKLYNVVAAVKDGEIRGFTTKKHIPNYGEFYEARWFNPGPVKGDFIEFGEDYIPFSNELCYKFSNFEDLIVGVEICEDLWTVNPPSTSMVTVQGASLIVNASASNELIGKANYRKSLVSSTSARLLCAYVYTSAGEGESTQDIVFSGHNIIAENGSVLAESKRFSGENIYADIDVEKLVAERRRMSTFRANEDRSADFAAIINLDEIRKLDLELNRFYDKAPFVPSDKEERDARCEEILNIQSYGLKKRLEHTHSKSAVIGISGGLDSTLALLVTARAFDLLGLDRKGITCVTMPGFGTTDRTYSNAVLLTKKLGCSLREISIVDAVRQHFHDINHDESVHDVTYENSQARERTQLLMDIANQTAGLVIGTGDLSELALGWATYNGDHMSMYAVNVSIPKTLVRHLVRFYADTCKEEELSRVLLDVLDTPVSPELLPPDKDGKIAQKTEDLVGPYELHDFFLYHMLRFGMTPKKLFRIAKLAFAEEIKENTYSDAIIYKWLRTFTWRFFAQQFKRSCLPDGPKVGSVAVSPRGDLRMPSDASSHIWMLELDELKEELGIE